MTITSCAQSSANLPTDLNRAVGSALWAQQLHSTEAAVGGQSNAVAQANVAGQPISAGCAGQAGYAGTAGHAAPSGRFRQVYNSSQICRAVQPTSMETLLRFRHFYKCADDRQPVFSYRQIATILLNALRTELAKPYLRQDQAFLLALMKDLTTFRHPDFSHILAAVASTHVAGSVKECAQIIFSQIDQSLAYVYEQAQIDRELTDRQRAHALHQARTSRANCLQVVQAIFVYCKGRRLSEDDGPLASELSQLLRHPWERVRLAASWVSVRAWANGGPGLLRQSLLTLTDLAINAFDLGVSNDALQLLRRVRELSPFADGMVKAAECEASSRFFLRASVDCSPIETSMERGASGSPASAPSPSNGHRRQAACLSGNRMGVSSHSVASQEGAKQSTVPIAQVSASNASDLAQPLPVKPLAQAAFFKRYRG